MAQPPTRDILRDDTQMQEVREAVYLGEVLDATRWLAAMVEEAHHKQWTVLNVSITPVYERSPDVSEVSYWQARCMYIFIWPWSKPSEGSAETP